MVHQDRKAGKQKRKQGRSNAGSGIAPVFVWPGLGLAAQQCHAAAGQADAQQAKAGTGIQLPQDRQHGHRHAHGQADGFAGQREQRRAFFWQLPLPGRRPLHQFIHRYAKQLGQPRQRLDIGTGQIGFPKLRIWI